MKTLSKKKNENPFEPDQIVRATRTFCWEGGVVHAGERFRGSDPAVVAGWTAFVDGDTLDQELENPFSELPPPPEFAEPAEVRSITVPARRQVVSRVDAAVPMQWAPGSPGATSGAPPAMARASLRQGQIVDVLSDVVRTNPSWFRWPARDVTFEDIERMERLEREGGEHG
jgi:hypothetical protein